MSTVFCFFKQKTAYDMRISDWSSDVCSADLLALCGDATVLAQRADGDQPRLRLCDRGGRRRVEPAELARIDNAPARAVEHDGHQVIFVNFGRIEGRHTGRRRRLPQTISNPRTPPPPPASSAERRVGKEG